MFVPFAAGWSFESHPAEVVPLDASMQRRVAALHVEPDGMWNDPAIVPASVSFSATGVRVGVGAGCFFESVARAERGAWSHCGVQVAVVTADGRVVVAQRSRRVGVAPGSWMLSAGESADPRVDAGDAGPWDPLATAARGVVEELAVPVDGLALVGLAVTETAVVAVAAMRAQLTFDELATVAAGADDAWERETLVGVPLTSPGVVPPLRGWRAAAFERVVAWSHRT
jgi:hypothetical protein